MAPYHRVADAIPEGYIPTAQAAIVLGCSVTHVAWLADRHGITPIRVGLRNLAWSRDDLERLKMDRIAPAARRPWVEDSRPPDVALLGAALKVLTYRERALIELRYGLKDGCPHSLVEVGRTFRVTRERARQIEAQAKRKLALWATEHEIDCP